jgi:hypothetical protein
VRPDYRKRRITEETKEHLQLEDSHQILEPAGYGWGGGGSQSVLFTTHSNFSPFVLISYIIARPTPDSLAKLISILITSALALKLFCLRLSELDAFNTH